MFVIEDEFLIVYFGDLGYEFVVFEFEKVGKVDIFLIFVGGVYIIDVKEVFNVVKVINLRVIIFMYYKIEKFKFDFGKVEEFIKYFEDVEVF